MNENVSQAFEQMIERQSQKKCIRNGIVVYGASSARKFRYLRDSLKRFSETVLCRDFETLTFTDIDSGFLQRYVSHLQGRNVAEKIRKLKQIFRSAHAGTEVFDPVEAIHAVRKTTDPFIPYSEIVRIREMERSGLTNKESFCLDLFLFGFYSGGSSVAEMAALREENVHGDYLCCERTGCSGTARIPLNKYAKAILRKYRKDGFGDYLLPVFTHKHLSSEQQQGRIKRITEQTNGLMKEIARKLQLECELTLGMTRRIFIEHMLACRMPLETIAEVTGCTFDTIIRYLEKHK